MQKVIASDTSCLILLEKIGRLELFKKLFGNIIVTQIVADEFGLVLPDYFTVENPQNTTYQSILETILDKGEASAIALCLEKDNCLLIIDDNIRKKRSTAVKNTNYWYNWNINACQTIRTYSFD